MATQWKRRSSLCLLLLPQLLTMLLLLQQFSTGHGVSAADQRRESCDVSVAGNVEADDDRESLMESETSRRILTATKFLSSGALLRDSPFCGGPESGRPYSSCLPAPSNPRTRGCFKIYRCRPYWSSFISRKVIEKLQILKFIFF